MRICVNCFPRSPHPLSHDIRGESLPFSCRFLLILGQPSRHLRSGLRLTAQSRSEKAVSLLCGDSCGHLQRRRQLALGRPIWQTNHAPLLSPSDGRFSRCRVFCGKLCPLRNEIVLPNAAVIGCPCLTQASRKGFFRKDRDRIVSAHRQITGAVRRALCWCI